LTTFKGGLSTHIIYYGIGKYTVPNTGAGTLPKSNNVVDLSLNQSVGGQNNFTSITSSKTIIGISG
jgi:hypothetical protein